MFMSPPRRGAKKGGPTWPPGRLKSESVYVRLSGGTGSRSTPQNFREPQQQKNGARAIRPKTDLGTGPMLSLLAAIAGPKMI